ncbi:hypothetical protein Ccrd_024022 [Cynara cardunculus var. scolymus]|uniref:Leucine-rich repeat-containing protein n=1 Tax=Cynara cardunculus var. scolymus TaxID=59895 RepID=A0A103E5X1_CYNCS|nr:hypothetical protein Ccrd_024022 [Cynara cardunculus var. scolymus]
MLTKYYCPRIFMKFSNFQYKGVLVKEVKIDNFFKVEVSLITFGVGFILQQLDTEELGLLIHIHVLNLSHNQVTRPIPSLFSNMKKIESLAISSNRLSGRVSACTLIIERKIWDLYCRQSVSLWITIGKDMHVEFDVDDTPIVGRRKLIWHGYGFLRCKFGFRMA